MNDDVIEELRDLDSKEPFQPYRIRLVSGAVHEVGAPGRIAFLSWGVYITEYQTHWSSFTYEAIMGFDSLLESE